MDEVPTFGNNENSNSKDDMGRAQPSKKVHKGPPRTKCAFGSCLYMTKTTAKRLTASVMSHIVACTDQRAKEVCTEHPEWSHEQCLDELTKQLEPGYLDLSHRRWCPGHGCFFLLSKSMKTHRRCGYGFDVEGDPAGGFRPSSLIEDRSHVLGMEEEAFRPIPLQHPRPDLTEIELPSLSDAALLKKRIYDPFTRPLSPAVGLLWMEALTLTLEQIANQNSERSWTLWLMLAPCTLGLAADMRKGKGGWKEWERKAGGKLQRWISGDYATLWREALEDESHNKEYEQNKADHEEVDVVDVAKADGRWQARVERLVRGGRYADAARAISDSAPVPITPEVIGILKSKFPEAAGWVTSDPQSSCIEFSTDLVKSLLASFPRGTSAGLSGILPELVSSGIRYSHDSSPKLVAALAEVVRILINGLAPKSVAPWIVGGRLIPVREKVRPIVVSDVLCH
jgi:hypothetical protein